MEKDLTVSRLDRQNILNNDMAIKEIREKSGINGVIWEDKIYVTREMTADFFEVDVRTIGRYLEQNNEELTKNGYEVLKGKRLKSFLEAVKNSGKDINVPTKTTVLGVFDFKSFLNLAMLMSESEKARALRQMMLDIVIDLINRKTGGGNKRLAITLSVYFLLLNGYMAVAKDFFSITENISYHVAAGKISKELLHRIMLGIMDGTYEYNEELRLEILNAISEEKKL